MVKVKRIYKLGCDANGNDVTEGFATDAYILGSKGANLAEMARIGLPVPPGFTITCQTCMDYLNAGNIWPKGVLNLIDSARHDLEIRTGRRLGDVENPLLVSVRSSAPVSMSGVMDTVLNLGLNDKVIKGLITQTQDPRFAWDSYCRFIQMFSVYVMGLDKDLFENTMMTLKIQKGVKYATELDPDDLEALAQHFKQIFSDSVDPIQYPQLQVVDGKAQFPQDPDVQLVLAIQAVFDSWNSQRALCYRRQNRISDDLGVAVNIMSMVYGNRGDTSATGVAFTRNPANGAKQSYGDYLVNAQGEDVVVGIRTAEPIENLKVTPALKQAGEQLDRVFDILEYHYRDMMDVEFTIEQGKLYLLQTRVSKRTAIAALKVALDMVDEGLISKEEALLRIEPKQIDQLLHPQLDTSGKYDILCKGFSASAGVATGGIVFSSTDAIAAAQADKDVILVRWETTPDDLKGMIAARGVLTSHGGKTSHAAVVSRGMGLPCVCGAKGMRIDVAKKQVTIAGSDVVLHEGDVISLDGSTGDVVNGAVKLINATLSSELKTLLTWADEVRKIDVCADVDNFDDIKLSRDFGADGIVLYLGKSMRLGGHNHEHALQESPALQVRAIAHATAQLLKEGFNPHLLIMIPSAAFDTGYKAVRESIETAIAQVEQQVGVKLPKIPIGAMVELPCSAIDPEQIAKYADFCCFNINYLAQTTIGHSYDGVENKDTFAHLNMNIDNANPFETFDKDAVGFIESISKKLREIDSTVELGICGTWGPEFIQKVFDLGLDYIGCSPYRVPIARLAAAQATLRSDSK